MRVHDSIKCCILSYNIIFTFLIVHCAGDITDLFDAFDGFNDSAYHAYIGMVQEGEYMEEVEGNGEDEGVDEGEGDGPNLAEEIANVVAADNNNGGSDSGSVHSSDSCSDAVDNADPPMGGDSTMYAQLYTDESVFSGNKCAVVTIATFTV